MYMFVGNAEPEQIAAITFTNKAANEMRNRLRSKRSDAKPWISNGMKGPTQV